MSKYDNLVKKLKTAFSTKKATPAQATAPEHLTPPVIAPAVPILSEEEIEKIKTSDFKNKETLLDAIKAGMKIASDKQSTYFSYFKSCVEEWMKAYKKLKPEDWKNPIESEKWERLVKDIFWNTASPKKLIKEYADGQDVVLPRYIKSEAVKAKRMIKVIEVLQALTPAELNYVNDHGIVEYSYAASSLASGIAKTLENLKSLMALPEETRDNLYKLVNPQNAKITLEQLIHVYEVFSKLAGKELTLACDLCYRGSMVNMFAGKNPVNRLKNHLKRAKADYKHYSEIGKRKPEFNKTKVNYTLAVHTAANKALLQIQK